MLKKLYIEPTSKCNFNCKMCFRNTWFDEVFSEMPFETFEKLMETIPKTVETIFFGGMGEPLFHKDILKMIKLCKDKNFNVELLTNGSILGEEMCDNLIDLKLDRLWVSLDKFKLDEKNEDEIGHPSTEKIFANLKKLNFKKYKKNSPLKLAVAFVVSKQNINQLAFVSEFIDEFGLSDINISNMYPSSHEDMEDVLYSKSLEMSTGSDVFGTGRANINLPYIDTNEQAVFASLFGMFRKMNFNLSIGNIKVPRRSQYCRFIEEGMSFVRSDGDVSPCMALLHNGTTVLLESERKVHHHSFGNVKNQGLEEIWNSSEYKEFRKRVKNFEFSPCMICGHCDYPQSNQEDCFGNVKPTCGACLWSEGFLSCP